MAGASAWCMHVSSRCRLQSVLCLHALGGAGAHARTGVHAPPKQARQHQIPDMITRACVFWGKGGREQRAATGRSKAACQPARLRRLPTVFECPIGQAQPTQTDSRRAMLRSKEGPAPASRPPARPPTRPCHSPAECQRQHPALARPARRLRERAFGRHGQRCAALWRPHRSQQHGQQ